MTDLKPCPFCGGEAVILPYAVVCNNCGAKIETIYKYRMFAAWNTRAEAAQQWIPVMERLPEIPDNSEWEDRFVLCTFENPDGRRYVLETHYSDGEFSVGDEISIDFTPPNYIGQMYEGKDTKLVAWMYKPLPQPPEVK